MGSFGRWSWGRGSKWSSFYLTGILISLGLNLFHTPSSSSILLFLPFLCHLSHFNLSLPLSATFSVSCSLAPFPSISPSSPSPHPTLFPFSPPYAPHRCLSSLLSPPSPSRLWVIQNNCSAALSFAGCFIKLWLLSAHTACPNNTGECLQPHTETCTHTHTHLCQGKWGGKRTVGPIACRELLTVH